MKFCVIGLGRFGYQAAISLASQGSEVLAVDSNEAIVESIRNKVTHAVCFEIDNEESLAALGVDEMDTVVVAMGDNFEKAIIITALLKKNFKVKQVIARAHNKIQEDILTLIGADKIIMPERDSGIRLATSLSLRSLEITPITPTFGAIMVDTPPHFVGKTLAELQLRKSRNVSCIGIRRPEGILLTGPEYVITEDDVLVLAGANGDLADFR